MAVDAALAIAQADELAPPAEASGAGEALSDRLVEPHERSIKGTDVRTAACGRSGIQPSHRTSVARYS